MIDLAVAAVFARALTEEQFETTPNGRRATGRSTLPPQKPTGQAQPAALRRQGWLRRLASPAS
jgi:hypothetical protein